MPTERANKLKYTMYASYISLYLSNVACTHTLFVDSYCFCTLYASFFLRKDDLQKETQDVGVYRMFLWSLGLMSDPHVCRKSTGVQVKRAQPEATSLNGPNVDLVTKQPKLHAFNEVEPLTTPPALRQIADIFLI